MSESTRERVAPDACSWCGRSGCEPERHPEALADMRAWEPWRDEGHQQPHAGR